MYMSHLGIWFSGGLCSASLMLELLNVFPNLNDSVIF